MRDVGTEMTPIPSQDPSRTGTPMGATTPSRSPRSSTPPTHKRGAMAKVHENDCHEKSGKQELSETELKLKTRGKIAALGIQLGKMNIASWASKEVESAAPSHRNFYAEQNAEAEYEARAAAWKEAEKAKHMARYKRDEVKIQAWEDHQKAKIEAKIRKLEVVSVVFVKGREAYNVIPVLEFGGTFRSMTTEALSYLAKRIKEILKLRLRKWSPQQKTRLISRSFLTSSDPAVALLPVQQHPTRSRSSLLLLIRISLPFVILL